MRRIFKPSNRLSISKKPFQPGIEHPTPFNTPPSSSNTPTSSSHTPTSSSNTVFTTIPSPPPPARPAPPPPVVPPGDQFQRVSPGHKITPNEIRDLNELIRKRYDLDLRIWANRKCHTRDRYIVEDWMRRSDAALVKIMTMVYAWDDRQLWKSQEDYEKLTDILVRLATERGKRTWVGNPPW